MPTTTDPRTDRIYLLATMLERLDPPGVVGARRALLVAQDHLARALRRGMAHEYVETCRYRVERARDLLALAERRPHALA